MLKDLYKYLSMLLLTVLSTSCSDLSESPEVLQPQESRYITFENLNLDTKVTNDDITSQEFSIWVFDEDHNSNFSNPYFSSSLKYDDDTGRWRFHDGSSYVDKEWGTGKHLFLAFNKVDYNLTPRDVYFNSVYGGTFSLPASLDMTYSSNYKKDLICAVSSRSADDYSPVGMNFSHVFASLQFNVINNTGQIKYITDFNVNNFRAVLYSNTNVRFNGVVNSNWSHNAASESNVYAAEDVELAPGETCVMFGGPVVALPQEWGVNDTPPSLNFTVDGNQYVKNFKTDLSTASWSAGCLYSYDIILKTATPEIEIVPTVTIEHVKDADGVLTHSAVNLALNLDSGSLGRIKNLNVKVTKDGVTYKNQTFDTVSSSEISVTEGEKYYLPQGTYEVELSYNDNFADHVVAASGVSPAPTYDVTANVSATNTSFTVHSLSVNISDRVLAECPLQGHNTQSFVFRIIGASSGGYQRFIYTNDSGVSLTSSTIISNFTISNWGPLSYGYYQIYPYMIFDDVVNDSGPLMNIITNNKRDSYKIYPDEIKYVKVGSYVSKAADLEDGATYVICAKWNSDLYWSINTTTGQLIKGSGQSEFPLEYVFIYDRDQSQEAAGQLIDQNPTNYTSESVGAWKSLYNGKYMVNTGGLFYFNQSNASSAQYVICANGWDAADNWSGAQDIDMCKDNTQMIVYSSNSIVWGNNKSYDNGSNAWQWTIYKVQQQ